MATFEQIDGLMQALGPVLDPLAIEAAAEENLWGIAMEEDLVVIVELDESKNCLVLSADLGAPPAGDRMALYELLLQFNFHWQTTGGNRMSLDGPEGAVVQIFEIHADQVDAMQMKSIVTSFSEVAKAWRELIQRPAPTDGSMSGFRPDYGLSV